MPHFYRVACASNEGEFCDAVGLAVRHCLQKLEDRRKLLADADELLLSTQLADLLTCSGLRATAEAHVNGHVDIVVEHFEAGRFRMLGESKIHKGPKHHCDGTQQLLGYCSGAEKRAFCLDFCKEADVAGQMRRIRRHFEEDGTCHSVTDTADHELTWSFMAVHKHDSGSCIEVLHLGCNLFA
jgi:hypothetical protein